MPNSLVYPMIRGARPDFAKLEFSISGAGNNPPLSAIIVIESIDYEDGMDPKFFHMTGPYPIARGRGQYKASGSIEWGLQAHRIVMAYIAKSGGGFGDVKVDISVAYSLDSKSGLITDVLKRVRIGGNHQSNSVGGNGLTTKTPLSITGINWGDAPTGAPRGYLPDAKEGGT